MKDKGNFFAVLGGNVMLLGSAIALIVVMVATLLVAFESGRSSGFEAEHIASVEELRVLSQEIAKHAQNATGGDKQAFAQLQAARNNYQSNWDVILNGNPDTGLPAYDVEGFTGLGTLSDAWDIVRINSDQIIENQVTILDLQGTIGNLESNIKVLQSDFDAVVVDMIKSRVSGVQIKDAQTQPWLAERIVGNAKLVLDGGRAAVMAANQFEKLTVTFGRNLEGMIKNSRSPAIRASLLDINATFEQVRGSVDKIMVTSPELFQVREAALNISTDSDILKNNTDSLLAYINAESEGGFLGLALVILGSLAIILMIFIAYITLSEARRDLRITEDTNEQNQNAILRLLDELADLADGDLTTTATVTEDFTGAIADSINFTIDQLRGLVSAINQTAVQVSSAAQETQATAMHLAEASEHQAQEIAGASAAVNEMAVSIDQVSANAAESSAVAERSVAIAKKGSDVVQATINGMDNIREQIQETSKRIKRLGESSQEIGDIVSLINDIADQTNILALNAAIQASMAGDAGRGFAVVADEVQRLAERSSAATKQIEALVKTIQTDTNEAVISMEQTTSEVVRGARLAQDAGVALEEIENVSKSLADLIQNISNAARQQASSAGHISNTMNVIQEITSQTSSGTTATAKSIGNLAQLANEMRASVAGFKLPEEGGAIDVDVADLGDDELLSL